MTKWTDYMTNCHIDCRPSIPLETRGRGRGRAKGRGRGRGRARGSGRGRGTTFHPDFLARVQGLAIIEPPSPRITRSQSARKN